MTNGEKFKQTFPNSFKVRTFFMQNGTEHIVIDGVDGETHDFVLDWWEAEYEEPTTKNDLGVDLISRADVLQILLDYDYANENALVLKDIKALPSVTPQPCEDAVSRQAVLDEAFEVDTKEYGRIYVVGEDHISSLPPVTPQEPRKGHWVDNKCDKCGYVVQPWNTTNFCPNCGSRNEVKE